jgi:vacuolar protein sorting-associated protein 35
MPAPSAEDEKAILDDATRRVEYHGQEMTRALDKKSIQEAVHHAAMFIDTLRDKTLSPRLYYTLYLSVTGQLRGLEQYLEQAISNQPNFSIVEMYEKAQHQEHIIPRLYLLTTVASVYIKSKAHPAKDILFDLVELARGVQHPMRGLFFRDYLSLMSKDKLPDIRTDGGPQEYEGDSKHSIEFILQNFAEMNKLWVRMQHQGSMTSMSRREAERKNLRLLVGTNLVRLSNLQAVDQKCYQDLVLPRVLEQVVNCKDVIAQEYLMDCIIQVFPDDFHLATLETFLSTCSQLNDQVNMKGILIALMKRLGQFATDEPGQIPTELEMFPLFQRYASQIIETQKKARASRNEMSEHLAEDVLPLMAALAIFTARCYPERLDYVDLVLAATTTAIEATNTETVEGGAIPQVTSLLSKPLESLSLGILELENYAPLLARLPAPSRKQVAVAIAKTAATSASPIESVARATSLFTYLAPIVTEEIKVTEDDRFEFEQEQHSVAQLFQLLRNDDFRVQADMYATARKYFCRGGKDRQEFTLPPFIMGTVNLCQKVHASGADTETKQLFGLIYSTTPVLTPNYPELALRLYLSAANTALLCEFQDIAYEFMCKAFLAYENHISDSKAQFGAIMQITATVQQMRGFNEESYSNIIGKCAQHSYKLLLKPQACRAVYTCAHLFWQGTDEDPGYRDEKRVLACLKKALKIANGSMADVVPMFIAILNKYLYFFDLGLPLITVQYLTNLIELIDEHMSESGSTSPEAQRYYENTLDHIKYRQDLAGEVGRRYREISAEPTEGTETAE